MPHSKAKPRFARTCWAACPDKLPISFSVSSCWSASGLPLHFGQCGSSVRASINSPTTYSVKFFGTQYDSPLTVTEQFESACGSVQSEFLSRQFPFVAKAERLRAGDDLERLTTLRGTNRRVFAFTIDADELRVRLFACVQQIDSGDSAPTVAAPTFAKIGMMMFCTCDFTLVAPSHRIERKMHMIWRYRVAAGTFDFVSPMAGHQCRQPECHHRNAWQAQHRLLPYCFVLN